MSLWPTRMNRHRLFWLVVSFGLLMATEAGLQKVFSLLVGYDFEKHPLGVVYTQFVRVVNVAFVALVVFAVFRKLRRFLPKLYVLMAGLLLATVWTGVLLEVLPRSSLWSFRASMWHMAAGQLATPILCAYVFHHVLVYFRGATVGERRGGFRLAAFTVIVLLIGAFFSVVGGPELLPFLRVHGVGAWLVPPLVAWHIHSRRARKRTDPEALASTATVLGNRGIRVALVISVVAPAVFLGISENWIPQPVPRFSRFFEPLPKDHLRPVPLPEGYEAIAPGAGPFAPSRMTTASGLSVPVRFLATANGCSFEGCHTDIGKHWAVSAHRHSRNPFVDKVMGELEREQGVAATRFCAGCHDPVSLLSGEIRAGGAPVLGPANEGVTCLMCHAVPNMAEHPSNGSLVLAETRGFFDRALERNKYLMTVLFLGEHQRELYHPATLRAPELCAGCHVQEVVHDGGAAPLVIGDKLGDWRASIHSRPDGPQGVRLCVDCHMPPVMESYQGRSVRSHRFLSSNTALPALYADDERYESYSKRYLAAVQQAAFTHRENLDLTRQHLEQAVTLAVRVTEVSQGGEGGAGVRVGLVTTVTNDRVGHKFPAGASDLIDAWLELEARDAAGRVLWTQGAPAPDGRLPAGAIRFGSEWYDAAGERLVHHELWKLAEIRNDRRIASGTTDERAVSFAVPGDVAWPLTVRVRLRHRRFNPDFARWVLGDEDAARLPITDVQDRSVTVNPPRTEGGA
ncbi:MAG: hypothetical protein IPK07_12885 [Deltaproteobacteria bacterium]|nr:hypothetical protein [Deltaproteobacteria bacterium]